jgi:hypothetical protein
MRRPLAAAAAVAFLALAAADTQAYRAFPTRHLGSLSHEQQAEMFQSLLQITDPVSAQRAAANPLVIDRQGTPRRVVLLVLEDQPGELAPMAVAVLGNTVSDIDVLQLTGDGSINRDPSGTVHLHDGTGVFLFQGTPSVQTAMLMLVRVRF